VKKVVYILGSTRCGTTMFDLVISSHQECASLGELCLFHKRACGFCGSECKHWVRYSKMLKKPHYYHHGFNLTPRIGHEFLSEKDIDVFNRYGGRKLNKELGYK